MSKLDGVLTALLYTVPIVLAGCFMFVLLGQIDQTETIKGEIVDMWQDDTEYWAVIMNNNGHYFTVEINTDTYYENNVGDHVKLKVRSYTNGNYYEVEP